MNHRPLCKAPAAWPRLRQTRRLALLFWLYFLEMPVPSHGVAQRLPSRIVAGANLQFAAAIILEPLDAPLASHCAILENVGRLSAGLGCLCHHGLGSRRM